MNGPEPPDNVYKSIKLELLEHTRHLVNATAARPHWLELKPLEKSSISRMGNYIPKFYTV
jgi:hypothetical protein